MEPLEVFGQRQVARVLKCIDGTQADLSQNTRIRQSYPFRGYGPQAPDHDAWHPEIARSRYTWRRWA